MFSRYFSTSTHRCLECSYLQEASPPMVECPTAPHPLWLCFICALCAAVINICACMVMFSFYFSWGRLTSRLCTHVELSSSFYLPNHWISFLLICAVRRDVVTLAVHENGGVLWVGQLHACSPITPNFNWNSPTRSAWFVLQCAIKFSVCVVLQI